MLINVYDYWPLGQLPEHNHWSPDHIVPVQCSTDNCIDKKKKKKASEAEEPDWDKEQVLVSNPHLPAHIPSLQDPDSLLSSTPGRRRYPRRARTRATQEPEWWGAGRTPRSLTLMAVGQEVGTGLQILSVEAVYGDVWILSHLSLKATHSASQPRRVSLPTKPTAEAEECSDPRRHFREAASASPLAGWAQPHPIMAVLWWGGGALERCLRPRPWGFKLKRSAALKRGLRWA